MEITGIETITVDLPTIRHFTARFSERKQTMSRPWVIIKLFTDEEIVGLGAAHPGMGYGQDHVTVSHVINSYIVPSIIGLDPLDIERIREKMDDVILFLKHRFSEAGSYERATIDIALYDIIGKSLKVPIHRLIGGRYRDRIPAAWVIDLIPPEETAKEAVDFHEKYGFKQFKLKVGVKEEFDIERVRAVKDALGDEVTVRVDVNGGWTPYQAIKQIKRMERYGIVLVEQPVSQWDIKGMVKVRNHVNTPIMVDESAHTIQDAMRLIEADACDVFNTKTGALGGIYDAKRMAAVVAAGNKELMMGSDIETGIGTATSLHLVASTPEYTFPGDIIGPIWLLDDITNERFEVKDGCIKVPDKLGLGVTLDEKKVEKYEITRERVG